MNGDDPQGRTKGGAGSPRSDPQLPPSQFRPTRTFTLDYTVYDTDFDLASLEIQAGLASSSSTGILYTEYHQKATGAEYPGTSTHDAIYLLETHF